MEGYLPLLESLITHSDAAVAAFARSEEQRLRGDVEVEKQHENREDRERDERFE